MCNEAWTEYFQFPMVPGNVPTDIVAQYFVDIRRRLCRPCKRFSLLTDIVEVAIATAIRHLNMVVQSISISIGLSD